MITVTKHDLERITENLQCPAHYALIFRELKEVYDPNISFTLEEFLKPFERKKFNHKIPLDVYKKNVKYSYYLIPLFYSAYVCKNIKNHHIIKEVVGRILTDFGHFSITPERNREVNELFGDIGESAGVVQYWGKEHLSKSDEQTVYELYCDYLLASQKGIEKS